MCVAEALAATIHNYLPIRPITNVINENFKNKIKITFWEVRE
jgi:hypothetical protein